MMRRMAELILHHYDPSPFSEKVRLVLGLKRLAWRSVVQPMVLPKPDLMPLTGGNRRTPVLQVGADVYLGTAPIAAELERRRPQPSIWPDGSAGLADIAALWADEVLFRASSAYAIRDPARFPERFHRDRAAMRGHAPPDPARLAADAPHHLEQLRLQLGLVERALGQGRAYLFGEAPSLADFAVYARLWWAQLFGGDRGELAGLPAVEAWRARIAAIGHGERVEMTPAEALGVAKVATPEPPRNDATSANYRLGERISFAVEAFGPDPVEGEVAGIDVATVALRRRDPAVGEVIVHLPRLGYRATRLA
jgi:glutathione S-transferase